MKLHSLLIVAISAGIIAGMSPSARAAKLFVHWQPPTLNDDGSPLTDLTGYRLEWGSCNADGSFGTYQAGINVGVPATRSPIYPTGLAKVCVRLFAINSRNILSATPAYASGAVLLPTLSQPTH